MVLCIIVYSARSLCGLMRIVPTVRVQTRTVNMVTVQYISRVSDVSAVVVIFGALTAVFTCIIATPASYDFVQLELLHESIESAKRIEIPKLQQLTPVKFSSLLKPASDLIGFRTFQWIILKWSSNCFALPCISRGPATQRHLQLVVQHRHKYECLAQSVPVHIMLSLPKYLSLYCTTLPGTFGAFG